MKGAKTAAFFDFDGTIYKGVIAFDFLAFAIKSRIIVLPGIFSLTKLFYYYFLDKLNLAERYSINERIYKRVLGWNAKHIESVSRKFFAINMRKKFYTDIVRIINWHANSGHKVVIVTSALKEIVNPAKKWIKVNEILAAEVETKDGIYTGVIKKLPTGKNRIKAIKEYCKRHNIDLGKSYSYSDHFSDIPLLESTGYATATRPDSRLRRYAAEKGWKIIK